VPVYRHEEWQTVFKGGKMRFSQTQVITFANQKGGCGKTSSSVSVAAAFAAMGYKACIVDTDPQCNSTQNFGVNVDTLVDEGRYTLADAYLMKRPASDIAIDFGERFQGRLSLVPGNRGLTSVEPRLEAELQVAISHDDSSILDADDIRSEHRQRLRRSLDSLRGIYDVIIIDTPPNLGFLMTTALIAADWFIVPVFPSGYDLNGLQALVRTVDKVRKAYNPKLRLAGVLLGNFDKSATLDRQIHERLIAKFGSDLVFQTTIGRSVRHREATLYNRTIFEHADSEVHAQQYVDLVREMINRGQKGIAGVTVNPLPDVSSLERVANG
jgi:chromosome partitioning protein